jgi:hypothetical protein
MTTEATAPGTTRGDDVRSSGRTSTDRLRNRILAGATVLGPLLMMIALAFEVDTGDDDAAGTQMLATIAEAGPDRFYASNLLAALGLALLAAGGLTVMRLVRDRGGALATAGGLLALIGGAAAAAGLFMYGAVVAVMTQDGLDREAMGALQDTLQDSPKLIPAFAIGFVGGSIAFLLLAGALLRSRVVPVWVPAAIVVSAVAFFFITAGGIVQSLTLLPLLVAYVVLAGRLLELDPA